MYDRNFEPNIGSNDRTTIKNCPLCQGEIPQDAAKCMHCGEWVNKKEKNRDLEEASTKFCPFCDSEFI